MSYVPVSRRTIRRHRESERSTRRLVIGLSAAAAAAWLLSVTMSTAVHVSGYAYNLAVVIHVLSLVVAFGAIILVDWHGSCGSSGAAGSPRSSGSTAPPPR